MRASVIYGIAVAVLVASPACRRNRNRPSGDAAPISVPTPDRPIAPLPTAQRRIVGRVVVDGVLPAQPIQLVASCGGRGVEGRTDAAGAFQLGGIDREARSCLVASVAPFAGVSTIQETVTLAATGDTRIELTARAASPIDIPVVIDRAPAQAGGVVYLHGAQTWNARVQAGVARLAGIEDAGTLIYAGSVPSRDAGAPCSVIAALPASAHATGFRISTSELRPVHIIVSRPSSDKRVSLVMTGTPRPVSLSGLRTVDNDRYAYRCVTPGTYTAVLRERGRVVLEKRVTVAPGAARMEVTL